MEIIYKAQVQRRNMRGFILRLQLGNHTNNNQKLNKKDLVLLIS